MYLDKGTLTEGQNNVRLRWITEQQLCTMTASWRTHTGRRQGRVEVTRRSAADLDSTRYYHQLLHWHADNSVVFTATDPTLIIWCSNDRESSIAVVTHWLRLKYQPYARYFLCSTTDWNSAKITAYLRLHGSLIRFSKLWPTYKHRYTRHASAIWTVLVTSMLVDRSVLRLELPNLLTTMRGG